jgi:hypothetical protein
MPSSRDSFRRNRVAPYSIVYHGHDGQFMDEAGKDSSVESERNGGIVILMELEAFFRCAEQEHQV